MFNLYFSLLAWNVETFGPAGLALAYIEMAIPLLAVIALVENRVK